MYTYVRKQPIVNNSVHEQVTDETSSIKSFDYNSIYRSKAFNEAMNYFDISDTMTRNILLSVNEADQNTVMTSLADKLYGHIVNKIDDIDFGTIPESRGDITKIQNYEQLTDCINIITEILQQYHQDTTPINTVSNALQNLIDRTDMFTKAYKLNIEMPIVIYNTIALSIVSATSLMISSCIEFIKISDDEGFNVALDRTGLVKTQNHLLFKDLEKFNKMCSTGDFDKAMDYVISNNTKNFAVAMYGVGSAAVVLGIILLIIPFIRELIFFFYYSRVKVADYFDAQATLLTMNAYNIENNLTSVNGDKKKIVKKQKKIADNFRKISNNIDVKQKNAVKQTEKETHKLNTEKYKHDEVLSSVPDSSNSALF